MGCGALEVHSLHSAGQRAHGPACAAMRNAAATVPTPACARLAPQDPRDFGVDGYTLRLQRMDRRIKLFICITLYNEDQDTLRKTLMGVADVREGTPGGVGPGAAGALRRW